MEFGLAAVMKAPKDWFAPVALGLVLGEYCFKAETNASVPSDALGAMALEAKATTFHPVGRPLFTCDVNAESRHASVDITS